MPEKQLLGSVITEKFAEEPFSVTIEQRKTEASSQQVAEVVAQRRPHGGDHHHPHQVQPAVETEVPGIQQNGFTRYQQTGVFQHHAEEDDPVAVVREGFFQKFEYPLAHRKEHYAR